MLITCITNTLAVADDNCHDHRHVQSSRHQEYSKLHPQQFLGVLTLDRIARWRLPQAASAASTAAIAPATAANAAAAVATGAAAIVAVLYSQFS